VPGPSGGPSGLRRAVRRLPFMSVWIVLSAIGVAVLIAWLGLTALRAASGVGLDHESHEAEDVDDLEVYLVCRECGTEFRVTRLGELQIPRHCGERMEVVRRPAGAGA
jgi:hypothetical protein